MGQRRSSPGLFLDSKTNRSKEDGKVADEDEIEDGKERGSAKRHDCAKEAVGGAKNSLRSGHCGEASVCRNDCAAARTQGGSLQEKRTTPTFRSTVTSGKVVAVA